MEKIALKYPIILASSSSYKKELLERLQVEFTCHAPNINEVILPNENPKDAALRLAEQKAKAIANNYEQTNTLIIGCDQVAFINDGIDKPYLTKPGNIQNAKNQLKRSSGKTVTFYTAFYIYQTLSTQTFHHADITEVKYRLLSENEIENYLLRENALDCAGSCKVEGFGISLLDKVISQDPTALIGLPLITLSNAITSLNQF